MTKQNQVELAKCGQAVHPGALFGESETETVEQAARRLLECA